MTTTSADSARADTRSVRKASGAIAIGAGQSTETIGSTLSFDGEHDLVEIDGEAV